MCKSALLITLLITLNSLCNAQNLNPDFTAAFLQEEVAIVRIELDAEDLDYILNSENWGQDEVAARFIYESSGFTDTIENVGFRLRGNTSLQAAKKSFKISFNEFTSGASWNGLKKINLNGEHNDVSIMRSKICWDFLRSANLPASRSSYVELFVNEEYKGLYLNVEHIDQLFVEKRFSEGDGNLYKCTYPANLQYEGSSFTNYQTGAYELKTNEWNTPTHSDLASFINGLNLSSDETIECDLLTYFNIKSYIRSLAAEILIGHWDGYSVNNNNYYLYNNLAEQRFEWIHYDLDNTLGIDWLGTNWSERNIYNWLSEWDDRPLVDRILGNEEWRNIFSSEMEDLLLNHFNTSIIAAQANNWKELISESVEQDIYYAQEYGFGYEDFLESDTDAWGGHVTQGILEYVSARENSAWSQLESLTSPIGLMSISDSAPVINETTFTVSASGYENTNTTATLHHQFNGLDWAESAMNSDGNGNFTEDLSINESDDYVTYYIQYEEGDFSKSYPCDPLTKSLKRANVGLVINEVMAKNTTTLSDDQDDFDDWIELYNSGNTLGTGSFYISDEQDYPNKWKLPDDLINSNDFLLLWCDDDPEDGSNHANFKLNNTSDQLYLYTTYGDGYQLVDYILFTEQTEDISLGRSSDGAEDWILFGTATPDASNSTLWITESENKRGIQPYPNPTLDLLHLSQKEKWELYDISGKLMSSGNSALINLSGFSAGTYLLKLSQDSIRVNKI